MATTNKTGLVSVVMPAYNAAATVERSLTSVSHQTHGDLDTIVVDDGSTDETAAIVARMARNDPRIKLVHQPNQGVAAARNRGILEARGDLVAFIDADDLWHPAKIAKQRALLRRDGREVALVYTWSWLIDEADRLEARYFCPSDAGDAYASLVLHNIVGNGSTPLVRKRCLEECGGFDPGLRAQRAEGLEDLKLWLRIAERYDFAVVPEFLVGYRQSAVSMSKHIGQMRRAHRLILAEARARHPELPRRLLRWSQTKFLNYLAENCALSGRKTRAVGLWLETVARDPAILLMIGFSTGRTRLLHALAVPSRPQDDVYRRLRGQKFLPPPSELQGYRPPLIQDLTMRRRRLAAGVRIRRGPTGDRSAT